MPHSPSPGDTPKRKHFPRLRPEQPPANPDICSFARPSLCGFRARFFLPSPRLSKIDHFTGGTGRQTPSIPPLPPPVPWNAQIRTRGRLPKILLYWLKWKVGGVWRVGGWQRRQLVWGNIVCGCDEKSFQEKQDFIHNGRGCEERGHILKEVP